MYGFGCLARGTGAAAGYGREAIGRRVRIRAPYGSAVAGYGMDTAVFGSMVIGGKKNQPGQMLKGEAASAPPLPSP